MRSGVCYVLKNYSKIKISSIGASTVREIFTVSCALARFSVQRLSISAWDILPSKKNPKKPKNKKKAKGKLPRFAGKPRTPATLKSPATLKIQAACREFSLTRLHRRAAGAILFTEPMRKEVANAMNDAELDSLMGKGAPV